MAILFSCEEDKFQTKGKEERIFERTTGSSNRGSEKRRPIRQEEVPISITKKEFSKKDEHDPQANETYPNSPIKGTITSVRQKRKPKLFGFGECSGPKTKKPTSDCRPKRGKGKNPSRNRARVFHSRNIF